MRDYGTISPQFWLGKTGKALRGKPEAQLVALYLMTSPHATAIGIYHCPVLYMAHETGLPFEGASKGLQSLIEAGFCQFDEETEEVFVVNMATYQIGDVLDSKDKRCIWVVKELEKVGSTRLAAEFVATYCVAYKLPRKAVVKPEKASPFEAPSKPLRSQEQEQEQDIEQEGGGSASASPPVPRPQSPDGSPPPFLPEFKKFIETERPDLNAAVTFANFSEHFPPEKHTPANWRKWVRREHPGPAGQPGASGPPTVADPDSRASVEALGVSLGLGKWVQLNEHWAPYAARVKAMALQGVAA